MRRLGAWLRTRGAKVRYVVTPDIEGLDKAGVDDFLGRGRHGCRTTGDRHGHQPRIPPAGNESLTDAVLAERFAHAVLAERYLHVRGLGWLRLRQRQTLARRGR